jgi:hypothetical protein
MRIFYRSQKVKEAYGYTLFALDTLSGRVSKPTEGDNDAQNHASSQRRHCNHSIPIIAASSTFQYSQLFQLIPAF